MCKNGPVSALFIILVPQTHRKTLEIKKLKAQMFLKLKITVQIPRHDGSSSYACQVVESTHARVMSGAVSATLVNKIELHYRKSAFAKS